jgi:hypothetical protein
LITTALCHLARVRIHRDLAAATENAWARVAELHLMSRQIVDWLRGAV